MKVIALERGYYGGKIQDPPEAGGEPFDILKEEHLGKWMEPQGWKPRGTSNGNEGEGSGMQPAYTPKHHGGGRWIVVDVVGEKVGDFVGTSKEEAQAEADRLIAASTKQPNA